MYLRNRIYSFVCYLITALLMVSGCSSPATSLQSEVLFTKSGAIISNFEPGNVENVRVMKDGVEIHCTSQIKMGSVCLAFDWEAGSEYVFLAEGQSIRAISPQQPSLALVGSIKIDSDFFELKADASERGASSLSISPDAQFAAIGTNDGEVILVSLADGRIKDRKKKPERYIRSLAFIDEDHLVVGEQAPAGSIVLYELVNGILHEAWKIDSGDITGRGTYDKADPYSWAHQPGIYRVIVGKDGAVFAIASYSPYIDGVRQAKWAVFKIDSKTGAPFWILKSDEINAGVVTWLALDDAEDSLVICVGRDSGDGALELIDANNGNILASTEIQPLEPHLSQVSFWRGVDISHDGTIINALTNDGRAIIWKRGSEAESIELGELILADNYPILISGAGAVAGIRKSYFITGTTFIPWELSSGETIEQPHPSANTIFCLDESGTVITRVPIPNLCQGFALSQDKGWLFASFSSNPEYTTDEGSGVMVISLDSSNDGTNASYFVSGTVAAGSPAIDSSGRFLIIFEGQRRVRNGEIVEGQNALHLLFW